MGRKVWYNNNNERSKTMNSEQNKEPNEEQARVLTEKELEAVSGGKAIKADGAKRAGAL